MQGLKHLEKVILCLIPKTKLTHWLALFFALLSLIACVEKKHTLVIQGEAGLEKERVLSTDINMEKEESGTADSDVVQNHFGKKEFFQFMKPIIERQNKRVMQERGRLLAWQKHNNFEISVLKSIARRYRVQWTGKADGRFWRTILDRVDEIPTALVLIQAANESAWGNSRFARQANNYFGQWCFTKGCGLVPLRRNAGAKHEVQYFTSAELSVRAYIHNLNTSPSYKMLRNLRHSLRRQGKPLDAEFLAIGLKDYSERGMDYVRIIQGMIRSNKALIQAL